MTCKQKSCEDIKDSNAIINKIGILEIYQILYLLIKFYIPLPTLEAVIKIGCV